MNERLHALVRGHVQGVSFRFYTTLKANELGVSGWVRNLPNGSVEVLAEGERAALEQLRAWLHQGSPGAQVSAVEPEWLPATGEFEGFGVR